MARILGKANYVANSLSKMKHKRWELYVISRVIHLLDDLEIEFICQQVVLPDDGGRKFADLYFHTQMYLRNLFIQFKVTNKLCCA